MRSKKPTFLLILILTTVTIVFWISYEVYLILTTKPPSSVDPKILEPISPKLDIETLDDLNQRLYFDENSQTNPIFQTDDTQQEEQIEDGQGTSNTPESDSSQSADQEEPPSEGE